MTSELQLVLATGAAALVFVGVFLAGGRLHPLRRLIRDRRSIVSFSAGMSIAYVFLRMMPELQDARQLLVHAASGRTPMPFEGIAIYFLALVGFLCFYALDRLAPSPSGSPDLPGEAGEAGEAGKARMANGHVAGLAAYVALMSYLLVRDAGDSVTATALYTLAFGAHFLALEHSLREGYGDAYQRQGRWFMAASCLVGWLVGVLFVLEAFPLALLMAFISGGVIMTNTLMELSEGKDGRLLPFVLGSLLYGLILVPLA